MIQLDLDINPLVTKIKANIAEYAIQNYKVVYEYGLDYQSLIEQECIDILQIENDTIFEAFLFEIEKRIEQQFFINLNNTIEGLVKLTV